MIQCNLFKIDSCIVKLTGLRKTIDVLLPNKIDALYQFYDSVIKLHFKTLSLVLKR